MKLKVISIFLALSLLFSSNATAAFFDSSTTITTEMLSLISKLSDDIGLMADRILVMADNIGIMADRIGEMSDRIVHTEAMMADVATQQNATAAVSTVIITNSSQIPLSGNALPSFSVNEQAPQMLVYVSSSVIIDTNSVSVLVNDVADLGQNWDQLKTLANNNKIYIAVKTINGNTISSLSNVLTYDTLY